MNSLKLSCGCHFGFVLISTKNISVPIIANNSGDIVALSIELVSFLVYGNFTYKLNYNEFDKLLLGGVSA